MISPNQYLAKSIISTIAKYYIRQYLFLYGILWQVSHSNTSIILQAIVYRSTIDLLEFINLWIHYRLHVRKVTVHLRRCPYFSIHMVAMNTGRDNQLHPTVTKRQ